MTGRDWLGHRVEVAVDMPAWSFAKVRSDGRIAFISPLPCPWVYGALPGVPGGDGDALDAVVLDRSARRGERLFSFVQGVVRFVDDGAQDDKLICASERPGWLERAGISAFFHAYAVAKRVGGRRRTSCRGVDWRD